MKLLSVSVFYLTVCMTSAFILTPLDSSHPHLCHAVASCAQAIADSCLDEKETVLIRERFSFVDVNKDGHITVDEIINGLRSRGISVSEEDAKAMFAAVSHSTFIALTT